MAAQVAAGEPVSALRPFAYRIALPFLVGALFPEDIAFGFWWLNLFFSVATLGVLYLFLRSFQLGVPTCLSMLLLFICAPQGPFRSFHLVLFRSTGAVFHCFAALPQSGYREARHECCSRGNFPWRYGSVVSGNRNLRGDGVRLRAIRVSFVSTTVCPHTLLAQSGTLCVAAHGLLHNDLVASFGDRRNGRLPVSAPDCRSFCIAGSATRHFSSVMVNDFRCDSFGIGAGGPSGGSIRGGGGGGWAG